MAPAKRAKNFLLLVGGIVAGSVMTLCVQNMPVGIGAANAKSVASPPPPSVWQFDALKEMALEKLPDIDWTPVESGTRRNSETTLFEGQNVVVVWEAGPAKLRIDEPFTYDEFVLVLKGELVLTDTAGNSQTYKEGDMFMVPKGFTGTWDMTEEYRELIIVDTQSYNADY